jgi:hypothetical protein
VKGEQKIRQQAQRPIINRHQKIADADKRAPLGDPSLNPGLDSRPGDHGG